MQDNDLQAIIDSISEKVGTDNSALIADDIGNLITKNASVVESIKSKDTEIANLKSKNDKLIIMNGRSGNVIVEKFMQGTEVTCGCYKTGSKSVVFPITEVVSKNEFFDYEAKYTASKVEEITPARIADEVATEISATTSKIYDIIGARGIIRVDYIIIEGEPYLLEVNTTPGMTETSFIPQQIRATGVEPGEVLSEIIEDILQTKQFSLWIISKI